MKSHKITWIVSILAFLLIFALIAYEALQVNDGEPLETDVEKNGQTESEDEAAIGDIGLVMVEETWKG